MFPCRANKRLRMRNLRNAANDPGSSQHCFLGAQTGKHLVRKHSVSEKKNQKHLASRKQKMFPQQMSA